jgi:hypothetical protein
MRERERKQGIKGTNRKEIEKESNRNEIKRAKPAK